jgi:hypothetical protein
MLLVTAVVVLCALAPALVLALRISDLVARQRSLRADGWLK